MKTLGHSLPSVPVGSAPFELRRFAEYGPLFVLLALGLALRLIWIAWQTPILQGDECEYLRIAENIVRHHRYAGLFEGPQVIYPPLYPLLIALVSFVTRDLPTAGLAVGVIGGLCLIAAMYALAAYLYGTRVALIAGALGACFPVLVELSGILFSQVLYLPLVVGGAYFGMRWADRTGRHSGLLCGACFGLAYLTRPEAVAGIFVAAAAFVLTAERFGSSIRTALAGTIAPLALTALIAAPYVAYLSHATGGFRLEGKSVMNFVIAERMNAGMSLNEAQFGLGPGAREDGPLLSPNRWILEAPAAIPLSALPEFWVRNARRTAAPVRWMLTGPAFGGLLTAGLAAIGLAWRRRWTPQEVTRELLLVAFVGGYLAILLGQHAMSLQYVVPLLPFMLVWAARGIDIVASLPVALLHQASRAAHAAALASSAAIRIVLFLALLAIAARTVPDGGEFKSIQPAEAYRRDAGLWLAHERHGERRVMSASNEVAYYAQATALRLPYATEADALRYLHAKSPDYVVLVHERYATGGDRYHAEWRTRGMTDPAAHLLVRAGPPDDPDFAIYEWDATGH